ncbi:MAG TPA: hypothetical protein PK843_05965 [bacterium]|nr:hypothetical protein [bacterium]HPN34037.1 hypothetical protein [bacterium]
MAIAGIRPWYEHGKGEIRMAIVAQHVADITRTGDTGIEMSAIFFADGCNQMVRHLALVLRWNQTKGERQNVLGLRAVAVVLLKGLYRRTNDASARPAALAAIEMTAAATPSETTPEKFLLIKHNSLV